MCEELRQTGEGPSAVVVVAAAAAVAVVAGPGYRRSCAPASETSGRSHYSNLHSSNSCTEPPLGNKCTVCVCVCVCARVHNKERVGQRAKEEVSCSTSQ